MSLKSTLLLISLSLLIFFRPGWAIIGFGFHWGNDFSLKLEDETKEQLSFTDLFINPATVQGTRPADLDQISGANLPIFINRTDWDRKPFDIGAKIFIDVVPAVDAIEISTNFGIWEYKGSVVYPVRMSYRQGVDPQTSVHPTNFLMLSMIRFRCRLKI